MSLGGVKAPGLTIVAQLKTFRKLLANSIWKDSCDIVMQMKPEPVVYVRL